MNFFVYALYSKKYDRFYIGYTKDLNRRIKDHKAGKVQTSLRIPDFKLAYYEVCLSKEDATARERQLKTGYGRAYLRRRLKNYILGR